MAGTLTDVYSCSTRVLCPLLALPLGTRSVRSVSPWLYSMLSHSGVYDLLSSRQPGIVFVQGIQSLSGAQCGFSTSFRGASDSPGLPDLVICGAHVGATVGRIAVHGARNSAPLTTVHWQTAGGTHLDVERLIVAHRLVEPAGERLVPWFCRA